MSRSFRFAFAGSLLVFPVWVLAQQVAPNAATPRALAAPSASTPGNVVITNAKAGGTSSFNYETGVGLITKDVVLRQSGEKFVLRAQRVRYSKNDNRATANGNLSVETENSTIRGGQLFGDFNAKIISITGNVSISAHGRSDGINKNNSGHKPVRIACNRLDWNYITSQATIVGNIRMAQEDRVGTCNKIIYSQPQNTVQMLGNVRFGNSKNQQFLGDDVLIRLDESVVETQSQIVIKSKTDTGTGAKPSKTKPVAPKNFPGRVNSNVANLPAPPPPIESLVPTPTPKPAPTVKPTPRPQVTPTPASEVGEEAS